MLKFRRIEIRNFVCFRDLIIEPSTDPDRRLTVIRAENGSGKTTFLRAVSWGMYGEQGLPGAPGQFSLQPAWWQPEDGEIDTEVTLEFETDGTSRNHPKDGGLRRVYFLTRSVTTRGRSASRDDEPDFVRSGERTQLMFREPGGTWEPHTAGVDQVVRELLPWDLREFFVMDADKAADFVGGSENKLIKRQDVIEKTTGALHSLLGIDVFTRAADRVGRLSKKFGAEATRVIGDAKLTALQEDLEQARSVRDRLSEEIEEQEREKTEFEDRRERSRHDLEAAAGRHSRAGQLNSSLARNGGDQKEAAGRRKDAIATLASQLESSDLLFSLARTRISDGLGMLAPLYERGDIPQRHVGFVRQLIRTGVCVCGQRLHEGGVHRRHVEDRLAESLEKAERADYLGQLHDAARGMADLSKSGGWKKRTSEASRQVVELDRQISALRLEEKGY